MQSLRWYARRLSAMSPREIAWRFQSALRDATDRYRFPAQRRPRPVAALLHNGDADVTPGFRVTDFAVGEWAVRPADAPETTWLRRLLKRADAIAAHRLDIFDLKQHHLGDPIQWNRDPKSGKSAPLEFAPAIDYRDFSVAGDAKFVWEPSRHQHLVVLARAYRASGDKKYAEAVVEQLESWLDQCPFGIGMQWRSPLELAIRLINWVWALDLIQEADVVRGRFRERLWHSAYLHLWEVARKFSRGSSANNHLIGEAAGVFIGAGYFQNFKNAARWREQSREILCKEIFEQSYPDGGGREQAFGYHLFVLQFFLFAGLTARWAGQDFPAAYWRRLEKMCAFAAALGAGGPPPAFGDSDDGYVLDLGARDDWRELLAVTAVLQRRPDFKAAALADEPQAGLCAEPVRWLLGRDGLTQFETLPKSAEQNLVSQAFPETGLYLLQAGPRDTADRVSAVLDCGELGYHAIAAHGHADALSFTLRIGGAEVLVDPGTYDYFSFGAWRDYFRGTRAHNTVMIDEQDQSEMLGPFLWGKRAQARCLSWEPSDNGGRIVAEHDGYARLADPVFHRRTLELDAVQRLLTVRDDILTKGRHKVAVCWHLAESCEILNLQENRCEIRIVSNGVPRAISIEMDENLSVQALTGQEEPRRGWLSRGYHRKTASPMLEGLMIAEGAACLICKIRW